jgi:hypothetical protein
VALATTRALVLQAFPYSETSKVLRLYTLEHGLRSVIAKGALRPRSRYGGVLEPFTEGTATFYLREGRDLHTLSGFDLLRSRQALGRSLAAFAGASLQAELVMRTATEEPHPALFHTLADAWDALAVAGAGGGARLRAHRRLDAGGAPGLRARGGRVRALRPRPRRRRAGRASTPWRGERRAPAAAPSGRILDPATRHELARMDGRGDAPAVAGAAATHRALLRAFLEAQLGEERPLRSLELFLESRWGRNRRKHKAGRRVSPLA